MAKTPDEPQRDPAAGGLSIFFPAFNDAGSIEGLVKDAKRVVADLVTDFEVWIIDDGSVDATPAIADRLAAEDPRVKVVHHRANQGYGGALRSGFAAATKGLVFYTDGDGQYDVEELRLLFEKRFEADVVNGYKLKRTDPAYRRIIGGAYNSVVKAAFGIEIRDVDCDYRLIRRDALQDLDLRSTSGTICLELVKELQERGFTFAEVPVHHYERKCGKSQFFRPRSLFRTASELSRLWWRLRLRQAILAERLK